MAPETWEPGNCVSVTPHCGKSKSRKMKSYEENYVFLRKYVNEDALKSENLGVMVTTFS